MDRPIRRSESTILRVLISAAVLSKVADHGLLLIIPLAVLESTGSVAGAILTFSMRGVAYAGSPLIGALIDRFDRRAVFIAAQVQQGLCIGLAAVFLDSPVIVAIMLLLSGLGGVASSLTGNFVLIPELISQDRRPVAVAKLTSATEFAKFGGFLAGGGALTVISPLPTALAVSALYLGAAAIAWTLPSVPVDRKNSNLWKNLRTGFTWLAKPDIGWLVTTMALSNLALGGLSSVLVSIMGDTGIKPAVISVTLAVGLFLGAVGARLALHTLATVGLRSRILVFQVAAGIGFLVIALALSFWTTVVGYAVMSFALGLSNVVSITFRQESIPVELAGSVNSVIRMFIAGAIPLSGMVYAWAEVQSPWFWLPAVALETVALLVWFVFVIRTRDKKLAVSP